jgi:hypothetical protein
VRTYFPLRSNSHGLVAGAPAAAVLRRIKTAALLGDVIVEDGFYEMKAGPGGVSATWSPAAPDSEQGWQTAAEEVCCSAAGSPSRSRKREPKVRPCRWCPRQHPFPGGRRSHH